MIVDRRLVIGSHHFELLGVVLISECVVSFFVFLVLCPIFFVQFSLSVVHQLEIVLLACRVH